MENNIEKRKEDRTPITMSSVEFSANTLELVYQFKIVETSASGMSFIIKEGSAALEHMKEGMVLDMKFYPEGVREAPRFLKTKIMHITKSDTNRYRGHYQVGIMLVDEN
ncbi:MAG: hypothetical protein JW927_17300 [Deltaproteobacteria bacterium]|nr:hypothetical protein [Deltaproteobacteria bacterium]